MKTETISLLIKRLQKVAGPNIELDWEIGRLFVNQDWGILYAPSYTASIDAAVTLVPHGDLWGIDNDIPGGMAHKDKWHTAWCGGGNGGQHEHPAIAALDARVALTLSQKEEHS